MAKIMAISKKHNSKVLEDAAQSRGARFQDRHLGTYGDVGAFSFQIKKLIAAGEGGAVATNVPLLYERAIRFHDLGLLRNGSVHTDRLGKDQMPYFLGLNYRMNEMTGAVMRAQLRKLDSPLSTRRRNWQFVKNRIESLPGVKLRRGADPAGELGLTIDFPMADRHARGRLVAAMNAENIPMGPPSAATPLPTYPYIVNKAVPHPALADIQFAAGTGHSVRSRMPPENTRYLRPRRHSNHRAQIQARRFEGYLDRFDEGLPDRSGLGRSG